MSRARVTVRWHGDEMRRRIAAAVNAGLTAGAQTAADGIRRGLGRGARFTPSPPGSPPNRQRGALAAAISHEPGKRLRAAAGVVRGFAYMIHERGGTITPKRSKYLPVPVNAAAKRIAETGTLRGTRMKYIPRRGSPLLVGYTPRKVMVQGRNIGGVPVFVLKKSVRIPARPFVVPGVRNNIAAIRTAILRRARAHFKGGGS
jgi:hypothetical protein